MTDCVSLPKAVKLVHIMREFCLYFKDSYGFKEETQYLTQAANVIERLLAENKRLKEERDAAADDLRFLAPCQKCKHFSKEKIICDALEDCSYDEAQAWDGAE